VSSEVPAAIVRDFLELADDSCVAILPHALRILAELHIPEALSAGPQTVESLAAAVGADPRSLRRLLRALASVGIFRTLDDGTVDLTDLGQRLRLDVEGSVHFSLSNQESPHAWLNATQTLQSGRPAFADAHSGGFFSHKDVAPERNATFLRRMRERAGRLYASIAGDIDWGDSRLLLDIGGGDGFLLGRILAHAPHLQGMLFDRPATVDFILNEPNLATTKNGITVVPGDFFEALPQGADTHLMCSVLHDWDDEQAIKILKNSRAALEPRGRLYIVELVIPEGDHWHPAKWSDIGMMVLTGGMERTSAEFASILDAAGYSLGDVLRLPASPFSVLTAEPNLDSSEGFDPRSSGSA
jgi:SAM-dependent methyltransferase